MQSLADLFSLRKHLKVGVYYASQTGTAKNIVGIILANDAAGYEMEKVVDG